MDSVLIVEDEPKISEVLKTYLNDAGFKTHILESGEGTADWVRLERPSLIILDLMLPGKNGLDLCREIRQFSDVPIIMVTARVEEIDRLLGLEMGADDYVCKPFSPREVVARVKANLRRVASSADDSSDNTVPAASRFQVDESRHIATLDGTPLKLTRVEFRILVALLDSPGIVLSRDQLMNRMYDDHRVVGDRTVDSHITNLRRKLQGVCPDSECVHSVYGLGYKLELA